MSYELRYCEEWDLLLVNFDGHMISPFRPSKDVEAVIVNNSSGEIIGVELHGFKKKWVKLIGDMVEDCL